MQRLLFGTAQAFVKQLVKGERYSLLCPVYGLGLVNAVFDKTADNGYHPYSMVELESSPPKIIEGLHLVFVELPKLKPMTMEGQKLRLLWLRFLRELGEKTREVDPDLLQVREIQEAVALAQEAAYTPEELAFYEGYWDAVSTEKTIWSEKQAEGRAVGRAEGLAEGLAQGRAAGRQEGLVKGLEKGIEKGKADGERKLAMQFLQSGLSFEQVSKVSGIPIAQFQKFLSENS